MSPKNKTSKNKVSKNKTFKNKTNKANQTNQINIGKMVNDPIYKAMTHGNVKWGNIVIEEEKRKPKFWDANEPHKKLNTKPHAIIPNNNEERRSNGNGDWHLREILEDFKIPKLNLCKNIWEHFPVVLVPLKDTKKPKQYAVVWHNKNLKEWRNERAESWDEWMDYQEWCEVRILYALRHYPELYKIMAPKNPNELFRLEAKECPL